MGNSATSVEDSLTRKPPGEEATRRPRPATTSDRRSRRPHGVRSSRPLRARSVAARQVAARPVRARWRVSAARLLRARPERHGHRAEPRVRRRPVPARDGVDHHALTAANQRRSIILNMSFARPLIPVSSVLTETIAFAASLLLLAVMMVIYGVAPTVAILWLPVVIAVTILFSIGCAYPASLIGLWFPDLRVFFISFVRAMFFLAPGLVALSAIEGTANTLVRINPLTGLFEASETCFSTVHRPRPGSCSSRSPTRPASSRSSCRSIAQRLATSRRSSSERLRSRLRGRRTVSLRPSPAGRHAGARPLPPERSRDMGPASSVALDRTGRARRAAGPSGSGKTSLLRALAGCCPRTRARSTSAAEWARYSRPRPG